ncbi:hypothetical protein NITLEN_40039 [Nitrospira lenta]|uniref:Uncharacterized protein n=1 Tax=Nitrospira lenta TaxID=1436998 RepID=A0A330L771_9BACT|nr:hypothetical protein NITLEN_40039 [Nitrospira lenta]
MLRQGRRAAVVGLGCEPQGPAEAVVGGSWVARSVGRVCLCAERTDRQRAGVLPNYR